MPEQKMTALSPADAEQLRLAFQRCRDMDGTLNEQLRAYADASRAVFPAYGEAVDRLVARLGGNGGGETAPRPGDAMPPFMLPDEGGHLVTLPALLERGPLAVMFFRGHWCPYCRISINTLAKAQTRIEALGARMVAIVPERAPFAAEMKLDSGVRFPILSDMDNGYALSLNLAIWIDGEMKEHMAKIGRELPQYQGNDSWVVPIPATFVVAQDGRIKARFVDPDYRKRAAVEELIAALK
jgi:peroxiredoxin